MVRLQRKGGGDNLWLSDLLVDGDADIEKSLHLALVGCLLILHLAEFLLQSSESSNGRTDDVKIF